ncbi:40S ribosomal protein S20 [Aphelenchoides bicaudatus]|nr:40S ribosomal protein S20 [Aphelenchoides bicaudatus]
MAGIPPTKTDKPADSQPEHRIRITLTSQNVKALEKVCEQLIGRAKNEQLQVKGPVRLPTKVLRITTRKTPCGEGSKTWDRFQMRIHKRLINLLSPSDVLKKITSISIEPGVDVEIMQSLNKPTAESQPDIRIRITLVSQNVKALEKVSEILINRAKEEQLQVKGPVRLPTKTLRITTRKTPCGEGSKTWDRFQRLINLLCPKEMLRSITNVSIESEVTVEVTIENSA